MEYNVQSGLYTPLKSKHLRMAHGQDIVSGENPLIESFTKMQTIPRIFTKIP